MRRCLQLAANGLGRVRPNPLVGCVVVKDGRIISEGFHQEYGHNHAERNALLRPLSTFNFQLSTLYVNLEPCSHHGKTPPCADLIIEKGIKRVVCCNDDPNPLVAGNGFRKLEEAGIEVVRHVLEEEGRELNRRFFTFIEQRRPYVILKWAESADGFIDRHRQSRANGPAVRFSTPWTQMQVHRLRATHEAILVGRRTWELDQPSLTTRYWPGRSPERIVLSASGAPLADSIGRFQSLLVEGGAQTLQSFIDADLWDEAFIERSPMLLGSGVKAPQIQTDPKGRPVHVNFT